MKNIHLERMRKPVPTTPKCRICGNTVYKEVTLSGMLAKMFSKDVVVFQCVECGELTIFKEV